MRRLTAFCLLLVAFPDLSWAQADTDNTSARQDYARRAGRHVVMIVGGHLAGGSGALLTGLAVAKATGADGAAIGAGVALYPLGVAAASYGIGRAIGPDGTFGGTLRGAYLGAGLGAAVGTLSFHVLKPSADTVGDAVGVVLLSGALYFVGTWVGTALGYEASIQPTVLTDSASHQMVPGVGVRLGL